MSANLRMDTRAMITGIESALLEIDPEPTNLRNHQAFNDPDGSIVFRDYCEKIFEAYLRMFPKVKGAWIAIAGVKPEAYKTFVKVGVCRKLVDRDIARLDANRIALEGFEVVDSTDHPDGYSGLVLGTTVLIRLISRKEYFGLIGFASGDEKGDELDSDTVEKIVDSRLLLSRLLAEAVFSKRLKSVVSKFESDGKPETFHDEIARRACLGLGADGAVLRIREDHPGGVGEYQLIPRGSSGLLAGTTHLEPSSVFEHICRRVYESTTAQATVQILGGSNVRYSLGVEIPDSFNREVQSYGIESYMVMRLESDLKLERNQSPIGTLSVFHRMPQQFSGRDISLFQGFCERVGDDLTLMHQLQEQAEASRILEIHHRQINRAEMAVLLAHDFGHKIEFTKHHIKEFVQYCKNHWTNRQLPRQVQLASEEVHKSCDGLELILAQIRKLGDGLSMDETTFNVRSIFKDISDQLGQVLQRHNMALDIRCPENLEVYGARSVLLQSLFNLVINSIDAQKTTGRKKKNTVHLSCREIDAVRLEFAIWDEGPGVSPIHFPDPEKIFEIGTSSKPNSLGTGTGLPNSRSLLGRAFGANLQLIDRTNATFKFVVHKRNKANRESR